MKRRYRDTLEQSMETRRESQALLQVSDEELARLRRIEERLRDFMKRGGIDALDALHILGEEGEPNGR